MKRIEKPMNQKDLYQSAALVYEKLMNGDLEIEKAEAAIKALTVMNTAYLNEIKRAKLENTGILVTEIQQINEK